MQLGFIQTDVPGAEGRVEPFLLLRLKVAQRLYRGAGQNHTAGDVYQRQTAHSDVRQRPRQIHLDKRADKYHRDAAEIKEGHEPLRGLFLLVEVRQRVVDVIEVAYQGGEGKQHHSHRDKGGAEAAEHRRNRALHIGGT